MLLRQLLIAKVTFRGLVLFGKHFCCHHTTIYSNPCSISFRKMSDDGSESYWRGVPLTQIYGAETPWGAPEFPLVRPSTNHTVLYHVQSDGTVSDRPPKPQAGKDLWDQYHVRLPCSSHSLYPVQNSSGETHLEKRWGLIKTALSKPIRNSQELTDAILSYNTKFKEKWRFTILHKLFNKYLEKDETKYFFDVTLPEIVKLALDLPKLIQAPIPLLKQHKNHSISLSQQQIASLLANAFFCTFPRRNSSKRDSEYSSYPAINFSRLYESSASKYALEKMKCICHYFRRVCTKVPNGVVTFSRRSVPPKRCPDWSKSTKRISALPVHTDSEVFIEHADGLIQVDFANRFLGGGVLGHGCVQEEIRFIICPELIASMIFTEEMRPNEAVLIIGVEQYSEYTGYGNQFEWAGDYQDRSPIDSSGRKRCAVLAIDALSYSRDVQRQYEPENINRELTKIFFGSKPCAVLALDALSYSRDVQTQYEPENIKQELTKAWVGFSFYTGDQPGLSYPGVATGNWGCGVYRGSPHLKSLLQVMACAEASRPMAYYTFQDTELRDDIVDMYNLLSRYDVTVGQLHEIILNYCKSARSQDIQTYLTQVLKQQTNQEIESEPMDISYSSEVQETVNVSVEESNIDNGSPDLFSQDETSEPAANSQVSNFAYFTNAVTTKQRHSSNKTNSSDLFTQDPTQKLNGQGSQELLQIIELQETQNSNENFTESENRKEEKDSSEDSKQSNNPGPSTSHTSRLFEEMEKLDESSGQLNLNTTNTSFLDVNTCLSTSLTPENEQKITIELSSEAKKKITGKITDYFQKKRT